MMNISKNIFLTLLLLLYQPISWGGHLQDCANQFINADINNAPTVNNSDPATPFANNKHLCFQDDGISFFAIEYWPEEFAPRWVAYKLEPHRYGENGCNTFSRKAANCYVKASTWEEAVACDKKKFQRDPFHRDHMLTEAVLGSTAFSNTGHDRGHMAPRAAFSWHASATYQTFSMANMCPQKALLNQDIWRLLEQQVLTWAVDEGPIYVVTGPIYRKFPHFRFKVYNDGKLNPDHRYNNPQTMLTTVEQHNTLFETHATGDILKPKRNANPVKVKTSVRNMRMPTGFYKVIYRPASEGEEARAIGFMLPHTYENLNGLTEAYGMPDKQQNQDFWFFRSRIDLIEEYSKVSFPGIPSELKKRFKRQDWWDIRRTGRNIRSSSCGRGTPMGVHPNTSGEQRQQACRDHLKPSQ